MIVRKQNEENSCREIFLANGEFDFENPNS